VSAQPLTRGDERFLAPAIAALVVAHGVGGLAILASMWAFLSSPFVSGEAVVALHAGGYRPAVMRVDRLIYIPPDLSGHAGWGTQPEGSAIGTYYAQGTIDGSAESLLLGEAPPTDAREALQVGDEIRVLFNPDLPHPRYEAGTGPRVRRFEPEFAARMGQRFRHKAAVAFLPLAALLALFLLLVAATRLAGPSRGRWRLLWLTPLAWLVPVGAFLAFQVVAAVARTGIDSR
jgi:hypothetical protein